MDQRWMYKVNHTTPEYLSSLSNFIRVARENVATNGKTRNQDSKSTYQNSGVKVEARGENRIKNNYYRFIEEIRELDYVVKKIMLFRCRWVDLKAVKVEDLYITTMDLGRFRSKEEHSFSPSKLSKSSTKSNRQIRSVTLWEMEKMSIVGVNGVADEEDYNQFADEKPRGTPDIPKFDPNMLSRSAPTYLR